MTPTQQYLIDDTPLGLFSGPIGPWQIPAEPPPKPIGPPNRCLLCGRPAYKMFCGKTCKAKFTAYGMAWSARLARTRLVGSEEVELLTP